MTRRALLLFAGLGILWGIPYAFIKIAVQEVSPEFLVLVRTGIAALVLLPIALWRGDVLPVLRRPWPLLAYTVAEIILPWYFLNSAEQKLPSATVGLLLATVPIAGLIVAFVSGRRESMSATNWLGLLVGLIGVGVLVGFDVSGSDRAGVLELIITVIGYAVGPAILARAMSDLPPLGVVSLSLAIAAVVYLPIVAARDAWPTTMPSGKVIGSVVILAVLCSAVAFVLMFALVGEVGPVRMTTITYLNPAVAVITGAVLLSEPIGPATLVGFVGVLLGSFLVTRRTGGARTAGEAAPGPGQPRTREPLGS